MKNLTVLIAEDNRQFKEKFRSWATEFGYHVVEASTLAEGTERLSGVDALITDHRLLEGDGNNLARLAKARGLPVAGITSSDPNVFKKEYVDIPESKNITRENFGILLECLFQANPREAYIQRTGRDVNKEILYAANILFQGFYIAKAIREGVEEIVADGQVLVSRAQMGEIRGVCTAALQKDPKSVFEQFEKGELNADEVYRTACKLIPGLDRDERVRSVFSRIARRDYSFSVEDAAYTSVKIIPTLEQAAGG